MILRIRLPMEVTFCTLMLQIDDPADMEKYITIWNQYQQNKGVDHPLVTDNSYGYNYTGISVILDENGKALAEIQYILDMKEVGII